jgi:AraC family transcriptional regulator
MIPRFEILTEKKIIGKRSKMTYSNNTTFELWRSFMSRRDEIKNSLSADLFSIQVYGNNFDFTNFDLNAEFDKWAGVEVSDFNSIPEELESFTLKDGLYAVFIHIGPASEGEKTFNYIFQTWLPHSDYTIDDRPHFEILGKKYRHNVEDSEEEIWIPIKTKMIFRGPQN